MVNHLGNVNEGELKDLKKYADRQDAIRTMLRHCIEEQEQLEQERNTLILKIRSRLGIGNHQTINIDHETGDVAEVSKD